MDITSLLGYGIVFGIPLFIIYNIFSTHFARVGILAKKVAKLEEQVSANEREIGYHDTNFMSLKRVMEEERAKAKVDYYANKSEVYSNKSKIKDFDGNTK